MQREVALLQSAKLQTQANRYAFLRQVNNKRIVQQAIANAR